MEVLRISRGRGLLCAAAATATLSLATPHKAQAELPLKVALNGQYINYGDVPPVQVGGRVLVPLRGIFEAMGASVDYDQRTATVLAVSGATRMQLPIGSDQAIVNGQTRFLDVPAQVRLGRTLVPLRFVSETLGATVRWNEAQRTVFITPRDSSGPINTPPPVASIPEAYYPPNAMPTTRVVTLNGTVQRDLPGQRRFEMVADNGTRLTVETQNTQPARLSRNDRVQVRGRWNGDLFSADTVRIVQSAARRVRLEGIVSSIYSTTRLMLRTTAGRDVTVVTAVPFASRISVGDRVRVLGMLDGDLLTADRAITVISDRATTTPTGQRVDFRGIVEYVDTVGQTLQVRGENDTVYVIRFANARSFANGQRVRVVGTYTKGVTNATSITRF